MAEEIVPIDPEQLRMDAYTLEYGEIEELYNEGLLAGGRQEMYDLQEEAREKYFGKEGSDSSS